MMSHTLKKGEKVVRTDKIGAGQEFICRSDEFTASNGTPVVFLEGKAGYFSTEYLKKVEL